MTCLVKQHNFFFCQFNLGIAQVDYFFFKSPGSSSFFVYLESGMNSHSFLDTYESVCALTAWCHACHNAGGKKHILAISPFSISCLNISLYRKYHLIFFVQIDLKCQINFWLYSKGQVDKLNAWLIFNMPLLLDSTSRIAYQVLRSIFVCPFLWWSVSYVCGISR